MKNLIALCCSFAVPMYLAAAEQTHQRIDQAIDAAFAGPAAPLASDAEFFRRVHLDLNGIIPTAEQTRAFLADSSPDKRTKTIDRLLASKDYARRMREATTVWLLERRTGTTVSDEEWNKWVEESFAANKPWDDFIRELIAADGSDDKTRAAIRFFDGGREAPHQMTQDLARLFLGMNLQCAQCHNHPNVDDYQQADYFGIFAYVQPSKLQKDKNQRTIVIETAAKDKTEFQSVFSTQKRATGPRLPDRPEVEMSVFAKGSELAQPAKDGLPGASKLQLRQLLARDLTAADNRRFAANSVNRFWFLLMGRGLVHPLDLIHTKNAPSHPEVFELLIKDFVAHDFDVKYLLKEIALSRAYQRASILPEGIAAESVKPESYRVAIAKGLSAEQLAWSLMLATGNLDHILKQPIPKESKFTYKDYVNGRLPAPNNLPDVMKLFAATFGNPAGSPEVEFTPSASQSLFLMNEKLILDWLKPHDGNLVDRLSKENAPEKIAEELYLTAFTRLPDSEEVAMVQGYLRRHKGGRSAAISEIAWALLTSAEFRLNH